MKYMGDYADDSTVRIFFTTNDGSGGAVAPSSAFEAADIVIYKNNSATQKATTNGITMTSPFDSVTGLHLVEIDCSNDTGDAGFWAAGNDYSVILAPDETVDSQTVVAAVAQFSIENRSTMTIKSTTDAIETDTQDIQSRLPDALVDGRLVVLVDAMTANVLTASALASDAVAEIQTGLSTLDAEDIRLSVGLAAANLDTQLSATNTNIDSAELNILDAVGSITVDNAAIASAVRSELAAELGRIDVDVSSRLAASAYVGSKVVVPVSALPFQVVRRYDNKIILRRFAAFQWTLNDVGDLAGVTKLVFTIKEKPDSEVDSLSILQIVATIPANAGSDGITYVNKLSGTSVRTQGSIVVQSYTEDFVTKKRIIVTATDRATALIENYDNCRYDIKQITASDSDILEEGDLVIQDISTRLISS